MTILIKTRIKVNDPEDRDEISIQVSNSVTGFELNNIVGHQVNKDGTHSLEVEGWLEHLDGFETIEELEKFIP